MINTTMEHTAQAEEQTTARETGAYELTGSFILRLTGFPIELIESFAAPGLALATDRCLDARQDSKAQCESLLSSSLNLSRSARRKIKRCLYSEESSENLVSVGEAMGEEIKELARTIAGEVEIRRQSSALYEQEIERTRKLLYQVVADRPFQEVLLLSSPGLARFTPLEPNPPAVRNSHVRQRELSWISYLQRLTTKNETISFFGPCAWGEFDSEEVAAAAIQLARQPIRERVVYVEFWVCEALAQLMSEDPEALPLLQLRLADDVALEEKRAIVMASGRKIPITPEQREFLELCAISPQRSLGSPLAGELIRQKLLLRDVRVPPIPFPFCALQKEVASWPPYPAQTRWLSILEELEKLREAIERAPDLESRRQSVAAITAALKRLGLDGCRGSQTLYASRMPVNEDCHLAVHRLALGKPVIEQLLNDAAPWYDLWRDMAGLYATRMHQHIQETWQSWGAKPVPLPIFGSAILQAENMLIPLEEEIQQAWQRQIGDRCHQSLVSLRHDDLEFLRRDFSFRRMKAFDNLSPDLQIVAPDAQALSDGRWTLLVAEIHPDFTSWQHCFFVWCPDPEGYARDYTRKGGQGSAAVIAEYPPYFNGAHTALWVYPFAHEWKFVRVPGPDGAQTFRSAETLVEVTDDDILLRHTSGYVLGSLLHTWNTAANTHRLELRGNCNHSPRLQVGRVIVQRETWRLEPDVAFRQASQSGGYKAYAAWREFRRKHGLPERVFIRGCLPERLTFDKDIKPVFIDFRSPLLLEMASKMMSRFQKLLITEMLPGTEDCWLEAIDGHHSSEFRTVILASRNSRDGAN